MDGYIEFRFSPADWYVEDTTKLHLMLNALLELASGEALTSNAFPIVKKVRFDGSFNVSGLAVLQ